MKKYIGIVKAINEGMSGVSYKLITKFSNDLEYISLWFELYPNSEHIILNNTKELEDFFFPFEDMIAVNEEDKKEEEKRRVLYKNFMEKD